MQSRWLAAILAVLAVRRAAAAQTAAELIAGRIEAKEAEMAVEWEPTTLQEDYDNALICDLLDMIVDEKVKTEDYNYVVERFQAMLAAA